MSHTGKRIVDLYKKIDTKKFYGLEEAIALVVSNATAKFNETVDIAINLNIDPKKSDQNLRGALVLPHGTGKTYRVAVFAKGAKAEEAKQAGADIVGAEDLVEQIQRGEFNFDRCIATPDMMALVGRVGKLLGPKGLMPNPKLGTVTLDVKGAVAAVKGGQVEYRTDKGGVIHAGIGKGRFDNDHLIQNAKAFIDVIQKSRPAGIKGSYVKKISLSSTMGPSISLDLTTGS
jgi:large subunit ribosomal protein L1